MNTTLVDKAKALAFKAHEGAYRKNAARKPYITHVEEVATLVTQSGGSQEEIADKISNIRSVAVDPPIEWTTEKCILYTEGARQIVEHCRGINSFLEEKFAAVYDASVARWGKFVA